MPLKITGADKLPLLRAQSVKVAEDAFTRYGVEPDKAYTAFIEDISGNVHDEYLSGVWAVVEAQALFAFAGSSAALTWEDDQ